MMNVNDQHFRSVGTFDRGYYTQWGRNPDSTERSDIFRISALDIHDINGKSWTYMKRLSGHVFDTLSTIHTTQGQEIVIGRVVHKTFLS